MTRRSFITVHRTRVTLVVLLFIPIPLAWALVKKTRELSFQCCYCFNCGGSMRYPRISSLLQSFRTICRHQQQIHANELQQNFPQPVIKLQKYRKSVFTILYILAAFYTCFLPIAIAMALALVHPINEFIRLFLAVATILVYLYPLLNPFLYLWRMNNIRNQVRQLVKNMFRQGN